VRGELCPVPRSAVQAPVERGALHGGQPPGTLPIPHECPVTGREAPVPCPEAVGGVRPPPAADHSE
jgi:hypothetical protein